MQTSTLYSLVINYTKIFFSLLGMGRFKELTIRRLLRSSGCGCKRRQTPIVFHHILPLSSFLSENSSVFGRVSNQLGNFWYPTGEHCLCAPRGETDTGRNTQDKRQNGEYITEKGRPLTKVCYCGHRLQI